MTHDCIYKEKLRTTLTKKDLKILPVVAGNLSPCNFNLYVKIKLSAAGNSFFVWEKRLPADKLPATGKIFKSFLSVKQMKINKALVAFVPSNALIARAI